MNIIAKICGSLEARISQPRLRLLRTIYFNLRTLPFKQAVKLPIFIYGRVRFFMLNGSVEFKNTEIKRGMVKIGINAESFSLISHSGFISINSQAGRIVFEGPATISVNSKIRVLGDGCLLFGKYAYIGSDVRIVCNGDNVIVGEYSRIAFETIIMNSGFHHVYNSNNNSIARTTRPVEIGKYNWIGNRSVLSAGTKTKPYTIIGAGSLLNRDYTLFEEENQMLGGHPAKLITSGMKRIFSPKVELDVQAWFKRHPKENRYYPENFNDDLGDVQSEF